jgi:hypothetical protein
MFRILGGVAVFGRRRQATVVFYRILHKKKPDILRYPARLAT